MALVGLDRLIRSTKRQKIGEKTEMSWAKIKVKIAIFSFFFLQAKRSQQTLVFHILLIVTTTS
jgi:hypothetical protein